MANSASQNPSNKVGRNSGAGPGGIRVIAPTAAEAQRGLQPVELPEPTRWRMRIGVGLGVLVAALGSGIFVLAKRRAERKRTVRGRLENLVRWR